MCTSSKSYPRGKVRKIISHLVEPTLPHEPMFKESEGLKDQRGDTKLEFSYRPPKECTLSLISESFTLRRQESE